MGRCWFVARTAPRAEWLAADALRRDNFNVFLPMVKNAYSSAAQMEIPLFPGYVLIRFDPEEDGWPVFRPVHRVHGWLNFGGDVPGLSDETVVGLQERLSEVNDQGGMWRRFRKGEKVRVVSQILNGFAEVVSQAKSPEAKVNVLLNFMGGMVSAQIPWQNLHLLQNELALPSSELKQTRRSTRKSPRRTRGKGRWVRQWNPSTVT